MALKLDPGDVQLVEKGRERLIRSGSQMQERACNLARIRQARVLQAALEPLDRLCALLRVACERGPFHRVVGAPRAGRRGHGSRPGGASLAGRLLGGQFSRLIRILDDVAIQPVAIRGKRELTEYTGPADPGRPRVVVEAGAPGDGQQDVEQETGGGASDGLEAEHNPTASPGPAERVRKRCLDLGRTQVERGRSRHLHRVGELDHRHRQFNPRLAVADGAFEDVRQIHVVGPFGDGRLEVTDRVAVLLLNEIRLPEQGADLAGPIARVEREGLFESLQRHGRRVGVGEVSGDGPGDSQQIRYSCHRGAARIGKAATTLICL